MNSFYDLSEGIHTLKSKELNKGTITYLDLLVMLLKHWILLFYESIIAVLMMLSIPEYPYYKFFGKVNITLPLNNTKSDNLSCPDLIFNSTKADINICFYFG